MFTNYDNGVASMGIPLLGSGIPSTFGTYYFVDPTNGNDGNNGLSMDQAIATYEEAYDRVTTNKEDVIVLAGYAWHDLAATVSFTKNRVHTVGLGLPSRCSLQGTKMRLPSTVNAIQLIKNTGVRNSFHNIKFVNDSDLATSAYCFVEAGEGTLFTDCAFHMNKELDEAAISDFVMCGDSDTFLRCTFGNDNLLTSAAREVMLIDAVAGGATRMKNCYFEDCVFQIQSSDAAALLIKVEDTAALAFGNIFKNCMFLCILNATNVAVALNDAVSSTAGLAEGNILFVNPYTNATDFSGANSTNFQVVGTATSVVNAFEAVTPAT